MSREITNKGLELIPDTITGGSDDEYQKLRESLTRAREAACSDSWFKVKEAVHILGLELDLFLESMQKVAKCLMYI